MNSYKKLDENDLTFLRSVCSPERVAAGSAISQDYYHDELGGIKSAPEALVKVLSAEEVSRIMKYACDHNIPVTPRGQGTGLVGAAVALHGGILVTDGADGLRLIALASIHCAERTHNERNGDHNQHNFSHHNISDSRYQRNIIDLR